MKRSADFSGFLGETFAVARDALPWMVGYIIVLTVLNALPALLLGVTQGEYTVSWGFRIDANIIEAGWVAVLSVILIGIFTFIVQYLFFAHLLAHRGFSNGRNRFLGYFGFSILYGLGLVFGFLLLIIPGFIMLVRWSAATAYIVGTDTGVVESFGKSWDLTRGHGWSLFFAMLVLAIAVSIVIGIVAFPLAGAMGEGSAVAIIWEVFGQNVFSAMFFAFGTGVFYLLNDNTEAVTQVFE